MADEDNKEAAKSDEAAPASEKPAAPVSEKKVEAAPASVKPESKKVVEGTTNGGSAPPVAHAPAHAHGHDDHGHGLAHTMPVPMLIGVLAALMALTVLTVSVTSFDLGAQGNLVVAMVIATVKAGLVVAFFMHLVWDKKLHLILFLTSVLFLILFLSLSVNDRGEYQPDIDAFVKSEASK
ncbi:MAG: cytochrome C oxidase subunit IV family protein [Myxococcota bacterium]